MKLSSIVNYLGALLVLLSGQLAFSNESATAEMVNEAKIKYLLSTVDKNDGISKHEAANIVEAYFLKNVGCGAYGEITETTQYWSVEVFQGYAGTRVEGFTIDKETGEISSPIGPSYQKLEDILVK